MLFAMAEVTALVGKVVAVRFPLVAVTDVTSNSRSTRLAFMMTPIRLVAMLDF